MSAQLRTVKMGLALVFLGLAFGIGLGISFGVNEGAYHAYIAQGIQAHPDVLDANSRHEIWRIAQRAHFHATGIAAFSLGLVILVAFSGMKKALKKLTAILIGLSGFYPVSWFTMFLLAPSIGVDAAHEHYLTKTFVYLGVGGLSLGILLLAANLFLGLFAENAGD